MTTVINECRMGVENECGSCGELLHVVDDGDRGRVKLRIEVLEGDRRQNRTSLACDKNAARPQQSTSVNTIIRRDCSTVSKDKIPSVRSLGFATRFLSI
jgi:hypothetical protein